MNDCLICKRIEDIKKGENKNFICELDASYVVLGDSQFYKGYTLLLSKYHCYELHELEKTVRLKFLEEMSMVSEVVFNLFKPEKLNYELLGNRHPHLHWHIIPRHSDDPNIHNPIWIIDKAERNNTFLDDAELEEMKRKMKEQLKFQINN